MSHTYKDKGLHGVTPSHKHVFLFKRAQCLHGDLRLSAPAACPVSGLVYPCTVRFCE